MALNEFKLSTRKEDIIGLENVDNTSDANKPISNATQEALDKKVNKVEGSSLLADATKTNYDNHLTNQNNPHSVTAEQVGARPDTWTPTAEQVGARPNTWTPSASDIGVYTKTEVDTKIDEVVNSKLLTYIECTLDENEDISCTFDTSVITRDSVQNYVIKMKVYDSNSEQHNYQYLYFDKIECYEPEGGGTIEHNIYYSNPNHAFLIERRINGSNATDEVAYENGYSVKKAIETNYASGDHTKGTIEERLTALTTAVADKSSVTSISINNDDTVNINEIGLYAVEIESSGSEIRTTVMLSLSTLNYKQEITYTVFNTTSFLHFMSSKHIVYCDSGTIISCKKITSY